MLISCPVFLQAPPVATSPAPARKTNVISGMRDASIHWSERSGMGGIRKNRYHLPGPVTAPIPPFVCAAHS
ncbi:hypothetical protein DXT95_03380 [Agrobacterium tumefaciens]|nr:hypothetical protein [Agrobacterium tumefaciens]